MTTLKRFVTLLVSSLALVGASSPFLASAQTYPYYAAYPSANCGVYNSYPYNYNCTSQGTLNVYVQVNNQ